MAADFMAQQVPLRGKLLLIILIMVSGCNVPGVPMHSYNIMLNGNDQSLRMFDGLLIANSKPFSGTVFTLFSGTADTMELSTYMDGKEHGEWKTFFPSKKLKEKRFFEYGEKKGEYLAWWENGKRQLQYFFTADEYEGTCREWNAQGTLTKVMNYKKGHEDGHQQWWYDNGKIKANYVIKDGRRYGLLGTKNCINVSDSVFKK